MIDSQVRQASYRAPGTLPRDLFSAASLFRHLPKAGADLEAASLCSSNLKRC